MTRNPDTRQVMRAVWLAVATAPGRPAVTIRRALRLARLTDDYETRRLVRRGLDALTLAGRVVRNADNTYTYAG